jgi:hypothetical protein
MTDDVIVNIDICNIIQKLDNVIIGSKSYYDYNVKQILFKINEYSKNLEYVDLCYSYINNILSKSSTSYFGKFLIENNTYQTINIKNYLENLNFFQIVFIAYQLAFINEYTHNYMNESNTYCPKLEKYCNKMDDILLLPHLRAEEDINIDIYHIHMITHPQNIILGDNFFEDIKYIFCNDNNPYMMFISPEQTHYDCDGFIILNKILYPGINCCDKQFTWTIDTKEFIDFFNKEVINIMNGYEYNSIVFFYSRIN